MHTNKHNRKKLGICKLTLESGTFVDSHLIPKALTKPVQKGFPFVQFQSGAPPVRRWSSWYDPELVTHEGEKILEKLDTWAITEFQKNKLIWSSWGTDCTLGSLHTPIGNSSWGIREVKGIDPKRLRLFFLSLLWRAAATSRGEFADVQLPPEDLEQLRHMICSHDVEPISFYPVQLTQLSTIGIIHNHAPIADAKRIPSIELGTFTRSLQIYRFYFDGLIAHIHRHASDDGTTSSLGNLIVGAEETLIISTQTYEGSYQGENLAAIMANIIGSKEAYICPEAPHA